MSLYAAVCTFEGCDRKHLSRGWCGTHYARWAKHGDVNVVKISRWDDTDWRDRFWASVDKRGPDECWPWLGYIDVHGYGKQGLRYAYRAAYELMVGPIPEGLTIDHLCRVTWCVNPAHMEPVTRAENASRGQNGRKTHCPQGHPYSGENLYVSPNTPDRRCRACARERARRKG